MLLHRVQVFIKQFIFLVLTCTIFSTIASATTLVNYSFSSSSEALGGAGFALPNRTNTFLENPAQLFWISSLEFGLEYKYDFFGRHYLASYGASSVLGIPLALSIQSILPEELIELSDEGTIVAHHQLFDVLMGVSSAHPFNIEGYQLLFGYSIRYYYQELTSLLIEHSVWTDLSFMLPLYLPILNIFPDFSLDSENMHIVFRALNLGYTFYDGGYEETSKKLPVNISLGVHYSLFYHRYHKIDVVLSDEIIFEEYLDRTFYNRIGMGVEYTVYGIFRLRLGVSSELGDFFIYGGAGIFTSNRGLHDLEIDYSIQALHSIGLQHRVGVRFAYNYANKKEKITKQNSAILQYANDLNKDLIYIIKDAIREYILKHAQQPDSLDDLQPILSEKYGFSHVPKASNGTFSYNKTTGEVSVNTLSVYQQYTDKVVLYDGSFILCNIKSETSTALTLEHQHGVITIKKSNIKYVLSTSLNNLDQKLVDSIQLYIDRFYKQKNRYPKNLKELKIFLSVYKISNLPEPTYGSLYYDKENGKVSILRYLDKKNETSNDKLQKDFFNK